MARSPLVDEILALHNAMGARPLSNVDRCLVCLHVAAMFAVKDNAPVADFAQVAGEIYGKTRGSLVDLLRSWAET